MLGAIARNRRIDRYMARICQLHMSVLIADIRTALCSVFFIIICMLWLFPVRSSCRLCATTFWKPSSASNIWTAAVRTWSLWGQCRPIKYVQSVLASEVITLAAYIISDGRRIHTFNSVTIVAMSLMLL